MKKLIASAALLLLTVSVLRAQGLHEINLSVGGACAEPALTDTNDGPNDLCGLYEPHYNLGSGPVVTLDYHFRLNRVVYLGAGFNYSNVRGNSWYNIGGQRSQTFRTNVFSVLPEVKLRIPGAAHFRLYGKAAAGVKFVVTDMEDGPYSSSPVRFAWNITPIGFEWGGQRVYGMAEICLGNVILGGRIGIGFRF